MLLHSFTGSPKTSGLWFCGSPDNVLYYRSPIRLQSENKQNLNHMLISCCFMNQEVTASRVHQYFLRVACRVARCPMRRLHRKTALSRSADSWSYWILFMATRQWSKSTYGALCLHYELWVNVAFRVLARYSGEVTWTEQEEIQVRRRIDWRLMPILCVTYGLQYYDKAMLSQAVSRGRFQRLSCATNRCRLYSDCGKI